MSNKAITRATTQWLRKNKAIATFLTSEAKRFAKDERWEDYVDALADQVSGALEDQQNDSLAYVIASEAIELVDWEDVAESFWP